MGVSAKRKKEKKQDFQKPKLKVGKAKAKPANQTDTSFRAKAIVLNQQSLNVSAPSEAHQFHHHVSLLSSRSDTQRRESLAYLTTYITMRLTNMSLPQPMGSLLEKMCPLILDASMGVRDQVAKLFQAFRPEDFRDHTAKILPFVRAGMTHLSRDIRMSVLEFLSWLLDCVGQEVVACPGGWVKTLESFITLLGWKLSENTNKWSSNKASFGSEAKSTARVMQVFAQMLRTGLDSQHEADSSTRESVAEMFPLWHMTEHSVSNKSNAYFYLDLFGINSTEESQILEDRDSRANVFNDRFRESVAAGIETAKQEGGELGRASGILTKALKLADDASG